MNKGTCNHNQPSSFDSCTTLNQNVSERRVTLPAEIVCQWLLQRQIIAGMEVRGEPVPTWARLLVTAQSILETDSGSDIDWTDEILPQWSWTRGE